LMPYSAVSWLAEVDISSVHYIRPISHPLIFISGAKWRTKLHSSSVTTLKEYVMSVHAVQSMVRDCKATFFCFHCVLLASSNGNT
jgi:hypothetical protein